MDKYDADFFKFLHSTMVGYCNWESSFANQSFCSHFEVRADVRDIAKDIAWDLNAIDDDDLINVLIYGC
jgi:hypothetical protein